MVGHDGGPLGAVAGDAVVELGIAGPRGGEEPDAAALAGEPGRGGEPEPALPAARAAERQDQRAQPSSVARPARPTPSRGERHGERRGGQLDDRAHPVAVELSSHRDDDSRRNESPTASPAQPPMRDAADPVATTAKVTNPAAIAVATTAAAA